MVRFTTLKICLLTSLLLGSGENIWASARDADAHDVSSTASASSESDAEEGLLTLSLANVPATEQMADYQQILSSLEGAGPLTMEDIVQQLTRQRFSLLSHTEVQELQRIFSALNDRIPRDLSVQNTLKILSYFHPVDTAVIPVIDLDGLFFERINLISSASIEMADSARNEKERLAAFKQLEDASEAISEYIEHNKEFLRNSHRDITIRCITHRQYNAYHFWQRISVRRHVICRRDLDWPIRFQCVQKTINILKTFVEIKIPEGISNFIKRHALLSLVQSYCHEAILNLEHKDPENCNASLKKARETLIQLKKIKPGDQDDDFNALAQTHIEACEEQKITFDRVGTGTKKIQKVRSLRFAGMADRVQKKMSQFDYETPLETFDEKLRKLQVILEQNDLFKKKDQKSPQFFVAQILDLEKWIANDCECKPQDLKEIYAYYTKKSFDKLKQTSVDLIRYILQFIRAGDIQGASTRSQILISLDAQKREPTYSLGRILFAQIENLKGNFEPLLALNEEADTRRQKFEEQRKLKKERQKKLLAEKAMADIQTKKEELIQTQESKEKRAAQRAEAKAKAMTKQSPAVLPGVPESSSSSADEKEERQARHQAAEARREAAASRSDSATATAAAAADAAAPQKPKPSPKDLRDAREAVLQEALASNPSPLATLVQLKGVPAEVEREISGNTWSFTKNQFLSYLKALGCTESRIRGSHETVTLPEIICVKQGTDVIMLLSDLALELPSTERKAPGAAAAAAAAPEPQVFGGSLTLPPWEGKNVPLYMREQILKARERLRGFALLSKASEAVKQKAG